MSLVVASLAADIRKAIQALPVEFSLDDLYQFVPRWFDVHPNPRLIDKTIQETLSSMVRSDELQLVDDDLYRIVSTKHPGLVRNLGLAPGATTSRAELSEIMGLDGIAALRRGMFKPAKGPYSNQLLLFHDPKGNPYGDTISDDQIIYVGQGKDGDQTRSSFNRILAEHLEQGVKVHLFTQRSAPVGALEYEGEVMCTDVERVYRPEEKRSVLQFHLVKVDRRESRAELPSRFGEYVHQLISRTDLPAYENRRTVMTWQQRYLRDRAFRAAILAVYEHQCAVCGEPLRMGDRSELQGAHIMAVADRGPDVIPNGICLCVRHHWAFDNGFFSVAPTYRLRWHSPQLDPHGEVHDGSALVVPSENSLRPHAKYFLQHSRKWNAIWP